MSKRNVLVPALLAGLAFAGQTLAAAAPPAPAGSGRCPLAEAPLAGGTVRDAVFGGARVSYEVSLARTLAGDARGDPKAAFVSTDYLATGGRASVRRPVIFLYNGGPNLSATLIQFGGLGPRRFAAGQGGAGGLVDNPDSPLDLADMVFVDPVGTGFSHAAAPATDADFWGVEQDADSIADFVTAWLKAHHRETAPVFLLGESYGGIRSIKVAHRLLTQPHPVDLRGEIIVSGAIDFVQGAPQPGHDEAWVMSLPSMAAVAWNRGKVERAGRDFPTFLSEAERFAGGDYASALFRGARLTAAERQRIAARMSGFIGLDAASLAAADLRPSFAADLLKGEHRVLSFVDGRESYPVGGVEPFWASISAVGAAQTAFLSDDLGVSCADQYILRANNQGWDWRFTYGSPQILDVYLSGTGILSRDLQASERLHAFLVGGYYDLNVPYFGTRYVVDHLAVQDRARSAVYEGGHVIYLDSETRTRFGDDLRTFIRQALEADADGAKAAL